MPETETETYQFTPASLRKTVEKFKSEGRTHFRLSDQIGFAVTPDEILVLCDEMEQLVTRRLALGIEPNALEKFAIRIVRRGIALW